MSILALDGLHVGDLELRRTRRPIELLDIATLYRTSFPFTERRTVESMAQYLTLPSVCFYRLFRSDSCVGMLHLWILEHVVYGEHFAIEPHFRNQGYGRQILRMVLDNLEKPILIEVEPPENELAARRLNFYEREGLFVAKKDYIQPPYQSASAEVALYLLANEPNTETLHLTNTIAELREVVYHCPDSINK